MEEALVQWLLASPVASLVATRITWSTRSQSDSALPAIVLTRVSGLPDYTMRGPSGLVESRVQVDCWAGTYEQATDVAYAVKAVLSGKSFTQGAITFQGGFLNGEFHSFESGAEAAERFHRVSLDFQLWHNE